METLADDTKFPESWLFKHRWSKGKKGIPSTLPNGEKVSYLTVGGRTTAIVASVQKKTDETKEKRDENSESEKEDELDGEEAMDVEEERVKRKSRSKGGKKITKKTEVLAPEPTITEAKHHSGEADRNSKLPTGATQDEEESQSDMAETDSADSKAGTPAKKSKRETKPAPDVEQEDEAEPQPTSEPPQSTLNPTTKAANKPKRKRKPKPPTGTELEEELGPLMNLPTRKSTRKSKPLIPATPTMPPPKPKTKKKTNDSRPATHVVHLSSASPPKPQKRKINPSATGYEEEEREGEGPAEPPSNTAEKTVTTTSTTTTTLSKKIKTTMTTSLQPHEASSSSHGIVAKNEDEDIWEGRRRSRRVSGRGVSPLGRKVI